MRNRRVNKHYHGPVEGPAALRKRRWPQIEGHSCAFTSSTLSAIVAPSPVPPSPPPPAWAPQPLLLLPSRQTNVKSFVDRAPLRSGPLSLCSSLILLWGTAEARPPTQANIDAALLQAQGCACMPQNMPSHAGLQVAAPHSNLLQQRPYSERRVLRHFRQQE